MENIILNGWIALELLYEIWALMMFGMASLILLTWTI